MDTVPRENVPGNIANGILLLGNCPGNYCPRITVTGDTVPCVCGGGVKLSMG